MAYHAIQMADGSVAIMQTVAQLVGYDAETNEPIWRDPTPDECLAKWHPDEQAKVASHQPIDPADIPADREFRNAWTLDGDKITHDMGKARVIKRDQLRAERAPLLAALDVEYQRADERGDKTAKTEVAAKKQALRDVPADPRIAAATTPEELKAVTIVAAK